VARATISWLAVLFGLPPAVNIGWKILKLSYG